ncbi:hypothetical protein VTH06DRAFT_1369 [Thermothelomyces fergusii]
MRMWQRIMWYQSKTAPAFALHGVCEQMREKKKAENKQTRNSGEECAWWRKETRNGGFGEGERKKLEHSKTGVIPRETRDHPPTSRFCPLFPYKPAIRGFQRRHSQVGFPELNRDQPTPSAQDVASGITPRAPLFGALSVLGSHDPLFFSPVFDVNNWEMKRTMGRPRAFPGVYSLKVSGRKEIKREKAGKNRRKRGKGKEK